MERISKMIYHTQLSLEAEQIASLTTEKLQELVIKGISLQLAENIEENMGISLDINQVDKKHNYNARVAIMSVEEYNELKYIEKEFYKLNEVKKE